MAPEYAMFRTALLVIPVTAILSFPADIAAEVETAKWSTFEKMDEANLEPQRREEHEE